VSTGREQKLDLVGRPVQRRRRSDYRAVHRVVRRVAIENVIDTPADRASLAIRR
jgi:hypothetical protein